MRLKKKLGTLLILFLCVSTPMQFPTAETLSDYTGVPAVTTVAEINEKTVVPSGKCIGVTLSIDGVIIDSINEIECKDGTVCSPANDAGLLPGDIIKKFYTKDIVNVSQLSEAIAESQGQAVTISVLRNGKTFNSLITPRLSKTEGIYKIGIWVKDATSGIGTLTFTDPETGYFAALGHGICNRETNELFKICDGNLLSSTVVDVVKSQKGLPGELKGIFSENGESLGKIRYNADYGISGTISDAFTQQNQPVAIGRKEEITTGDAYIYSNIEGNRIEKYNIEILNIISDSDSMSKNMVIKIKDERLLEKTGGIVQGMSGSPILQNGKLVGAVTHVFVNDPTRGYGIFIENMLADKEPNK